MRRAITMDWLREHARVLLWGTAGLLAAALLVRQQVLEQSIDAEVVEPARRMQPAPSASAPPPAPAKIDLERLAARNRSAPERDLFSARDWRPPAAPKISQRAPELQEEPLPPMPYTYLGRWVEPKGVVVMLGRDGRSYLARVGDVLEATYRVDTIDATQIGLTYLPRNATQTLSIAPDGASRSQSPTGIGRADVANADAVLQVTMPDTAAIGEDILLLVRLDPRKVVAIERASVELRYDPNVLNAIVRGAGRPAPPGRLALDLSGGYVGHSGPSTVVRLRVIAAAATATQITFADVQASDLESRAVAVVVDGPNPRAITIERPK